MKLVIQVPCFNEEGTLRRTLEDLPGPFPPFRAVDVVVIDDGSTDGTAEVARSFGAHVVTWPRNRGLARAFEAGLKAALDLGADIVVNTDGDHQYRGGDIPALVAPVVAGSAGMSVGDRGVPDHFSRVRAYLGRLGNWAVRWSSGLDTVADASSGFRAFSRAAALSTVVYSSFSYTLESLILARERRIEVCWVPVGVNPPLRPPRLYTSTVGYLFRSAVTILKATWMTRPGRIVWPAAGAVSMLAVAASFPPESPFRSMPVLAGVLFSIVLQAVWAWWVGVNSGRSRRATERRMLSLNERADNGPRENNEGVDSPFLTG